MGIATIAMATNKYYKVLVSVGVNFVFTSFLVIEFVNGANIGIKP